MSVFAIPVNRMDLSAYPGFSIEIGVGVGHSSQTRSFAPAATFACVRLRNFCFRKRPSFLVSSTVYSWIPDTDLMVYQRQSQIVKSHMPIYDRRVFYGIAITDVP